MQPNNQRNKPQRNKPGIPKSPAVRSRRERGNVFIEFGLVSIILLPMFFGVIDYSRVFYYAAVVQGAARAGTQYAVFQTPNQANTAGIQAAAQNDASSVSQTLTVNSTTFCVCAGSTTQYSCSTISCGSASVYGYSQVTTQLTFNTIFRYPLLPSSITLNGKSIMRYQ